MLLAVVEPYRAVRRESELMAGLIALLAATAAAVFVMVRAGRSADGEKRQMLTLKIVALLAVASIAFAFKGLPLALMILFAIGGVTAIELWRARMIGASETAASGGPAGKLDAKEAAAVLGVAIDASPEDIKAAHKKLISQLHPDHGGSDYLAAKINDARRVMLATRAIENN